MIPTESDEQKELFQWAEYMWRTGKYPSLRWMYHVPNGGYRNPATAGRLKAEGVKSGVPDICLPVPRGEYHGLYIELKRQKGGKVQPDQTEWLEELGRQGYCVAICPGRDSAIDTIEKYLGRGKNG